MYLAKVIVTLRKSILDPSGKAVHHALESLGMNSVKDVRIGKYIEVKLDNANRDEAERAAREACEKVLANSVMEDFSCSIEKL